MKLILLTLTACTLAVIPADAANITGELRKWHKVTLSFQGPDTSETATPNPFTNYRLDVTFRHAASGKTYLVPGYYAADGNAGNTSASSGNVWRAHFAPDETGTWSYTASFRSGSNVATGTPGSGSSAGHFDGETGNLNISPTDKSGRDLRGKGRLQYVGKHHLRFAQTGDYFMKAGVDAPENLLAYQDFDGGFKTDGQGDEFIKDWQPHVQDWNTGDPVWQGTKGKGLIGAINYLAAEGLNAFSFLTFNVQGDDKNVFPYTSYSERSRLDVSKLDQWEVVFEHGTRKGMYLHFKTQETENELLLDSGNLGNQRKLYYRELIARFGHHLALNWNLGEEINGASLQQKQAWAQYFYDTDPYHHHMVIHNGATHYNMMGDASKLTGFSLQLNASDFTDNFTMTKDYIDRSVAAGKPWVVATDEPGDSRYSLRPDADPGSSHTDARKHALWGNFMAGGAGVEFYFGYALAHSDLTCNDFRSRDSFWPFCRHALGFFATSGVPFHEMKNANALVSGNGSNANRCLAKPGTAYLLHLPSGGSPTLDLSGQSGSYRVHWFDPRNGGALLGGNTLSGGATRNIGSPPNSTSSDWVVLVQNTTTPPPGNEAPVVSAGTDKSASLSGGSASVTLNGSAADDGLPSGSTLARAWTRISGPAAVSFSAPDSATTTATFTVAGSYTLRFSASDGELASSDDVVVTISDAGATNQAPVANAGPDRSAVLSGSSVQIALSGTASDDGLPQGSTLQALWSLVSGPASVSFSPSDTAATSASFTAAGSYVLRLSVSDGALSDSDDVGVVISSSSGGGTTAVPATQDAFTENGKNANTTILRVQNSDYRTRKSYLQFDTRSLAGPFSSSTLRLVQNGDLSGGTMTLRLYAAASNNWSESTITSTNAPARGAQLATLTANFTAGLVVSFDVSAAVTGPGLYSFILEADPSSRDTAFASSENSTGSARPSLIVTTGGGAPANQAPVVHAGSDQSTFIRSEPVTIALNGSAADDGLPQGSALSLAWTRTSGPAAVSFSAPSSASTNATFTQEGTYVLRLTASDGALSDSDEVTVTVNGAPQGTIPASFPAVHDAYTENGQNVNNGSLRVENSSRKRISYLQFDLRNAPGPASSAVLRLTENDDVSSGTMTLRLFQATSDDWTESTVTGSNAPARGPQVASFTGDITNGRVLSFDVSGFVGAPGIYSFILEADPSTLDVSLSSSENSTTSSRPALTIVAGAASAASVANMAVDPGGISGMTPVLERMEENRIQIRSEGRPGFVYEVQRSLDLLTWKTVARAAAEEDGVVHFADPEPPPGRAFYRLSAP